MNALANMFASHWAFGFLLAAPVLSLLQIAAGWRSRRLLRRLGAGPALQGSLSRPRRFAWLTGVLFSFALTALVVGIAGPRWGFEEKPAMVPGRDLVVVLDMSRSMRAADAPPTRFARSVQGLLQLVDYCRQRGGHRLALVVFAADAQIVCPLTHDYDHIQMKLETLDLDHPPPGLRPSPDAVSGTRLGAGLRAAVLAAADGLPGHVDILLVSDGDDPAGDNEWEVGTRVAETARLAVYTVGVGDSAQETEIAVPGRDAPAKTRLVEQPLRSMASRTGGQYFRAGVEPMRVDLLFAQRIEPRGTTLPTGDDTPTPRPRQVWFYLLALVLFTLGGLTQYGWSMRRNSPIEKAR